MGIETPKKWRVRTYRNQLATQEQQQVMLAAMSWWHAMLLHPTYGRPAREWLLTYSISGVMPPPLNQPNSFYQPELGYAPTMLDPYFVEQFVGYMYDTLHESVPNWRMEAATLGIFHEDGTPRISDRIVFASADMEDNMMWFQARLLTEEKIGRYANATGVLQHPFRLQPLECRFPGTCFVKV